MSTAKAVWRNGQVVLEGGANWPEGRRLIVQEETLEPVSFMTEEDQGDDRQAIERWIDGLRSIPPVPEDPAQEAAWQEWEKQSRLFNLEAVRRQFEEGVP